MRPNLDRLATIVVLQDAGFRLDEIAAVLEPGAFDNGKHILEAKLSEQRQRRDRLDRAIEGITHAIDCANPAPLECTGLRQHLDDALAAARQRNAALDAGMGPRSAASPRAALIVLDARGD